MVCRSTPVNSAATSLARLLSGVHDVQVLSMFHELRREAQHTDGGMPAPTAGNYQAWIAGATQRARTSTTLSAARREAIINRFNAASHQARVTGNRPDGPTFHALQEIEARSGRASQELEAHFDQIATRHHTLRAVVRSRFDQLVSDNQAAGRQGPSAPEHLPFDRSYLPADRSTLYALSLLHQASPNTMATPDGVAMAENRAQYTSGSIGRETANRCPDCGQFQSQEHVCVHTQTVNSPAVLTDDMTPAERARVFFGFGPNVTTPPADEDSLERDDIAADAGVDPATQARIEHAAVWTEFIRNSDASIDDTATEARNAAQFAADHATEPWFVAAAARARSRLERENARAGVAEATYEFCTRHGGPWGQDETCPQCTTPNGDVRAYPTFPAAPTAPDPARVETSPYVPTPPSPPARTGRQRTPTRTYDRPDSSVQMTNLSQLRTELRTHRTTQTWPTPQTCPQEVRVVLRTRAEGGATLMTVVEGTVLANDTGGRRTATHDRYNVTTPPVDLDTGTIRSLRCTCPAYRAHYNCEHLRQAASQVAARLNDRDAATIPTSTTNTVRDELNRDYQASIASTADAQASWAPETSFSTDMNAFQTGWDTARARIDAGNTRVPYMTENVTGGLGSRETGRSFGIEIEIDFPDDLTYEARNQVAAEIHAAGMSQDPVVHNWHWSGRRNDNRGRTMGGGYSDAPNRWAVEFDSSVDGLGGQRGCEIVSPILYDEPQTWENLQKICEIVERHGGKATPLTGLHINVGASDFNHTVGNHNRLLQVSSAYEDVLIRMSHNPEAGPNHRGRTYCTTNTVPAAGYRRIRDAQITNGHRSLINLDHVPSEGSPITSGTRVEIRAFDGTTDPGRIQAAAKIGLGMVAAAVRGENVPTEPEPAGTHLAANPRRTRQTGEAWRQDTTSFRRFVDQIFSRDVDKNQVMTMFAATRWQRR